MQSFQAVLKYLFITFQTVIWKHPIFKFVMTTILFSNFLKRKFLMNQGQLASAITLLRRSYLFARSSVL